MSTELNLFLSTKDYYCELHENFQRAKDSIFIIGWDIHSEVDLLPHKKSSIPSKLHPFLNYIAKQNRQLKIFLLPWEHAFFYTLERDIFLEAKFNWQSPSNIKLTTDGTVPIGGSHHQKIVLIDDSLVYCGGTDLTVHRWDDQEHLPHNPARVLLNGMHYPPYHELQVRCTGPLVEQFSKMVRERYQHVTGNEIPFACGPNHDLLRSD